MTAPEWAREELRATARAIEDALEPWRKLGEATSAPPPRIRHVRDLDPDDGSPGYWHPSDEPPIEPPPEAEEEPEPVRGPRRPVLPNVGQLNAFSHATLTKAVKGFAHDMTRGDVERLAGLSGPDARRVRLMYAELKLLRLNAAGKLVVDPRVARLRSLIVLRYLDEGGVRWLDPIIELPGRLG